MVRSPRKGQTTLRATMSVTGIGLVPDTAEFLKSRISLAYQESKPLTRPLIIGKSESFSSEARSRASSSERIFK